MNALQSCLTKPPPRGVSLETAHQKSFHTPLRRFLPPTFHRRSLPRSFWPKRVAAPPALKGRPASSGAGDEDGEDGGSEALETVLKLYSAIKNRNLSEVSEVIGDECRVLCNFMSCFQPVQGKKQVLDFFNAFIKFIGTNIQILVRPTSTEGMVIGVSWRLECKRTHVPLGKGFSFHICHTYKGKVYIRNVEMFMEPLLHLEPLRVKIITYLMNFGETVGTGTCTIPLTKRQAVAILVFLSLLFFAVSISFFI